MLCRRCLLELLATRRGSGRHTVPSARMTRSWSGDLAGARKVSLELLSPARGATDARGPTRRTELFRAFMKTGANGARLQLKLRALVSGDDGMSIPPPSAARHRPAVARAGARDRRPRPVDCYLETADQANVGFYERHGFVVENSSLQLVPDGPAHVAMRRRSRQMTRSDRRQ